jgi:hypothetical protein
MPISPDSFRLRIRFIVSRSVGAAGQRIQADTACHSGQKHQDAGEYSRQNLYRGARTGRIASASCDHIMRKDSGRTYGVIVLTTLPGADVSVPLVDRTR